MTDDTQAPPPPPVEIAPVETVIEPTAPRGGTPLWLTLLLVAGLAGEPFALHHFLPPPPAPPPPPTPVIDMSRVDALDQRVAAALRRIDALEHATPMTALATAASSGSLGGDAGLIQALESRLAALESRPAPTMPDVEGQVTAANAALNARIADLDAAIQKDVAQSTARAAFANRLRAASWALEAGKPLGVIPDAPVALARFADTAPPTEPGLRLTFPRYEEAARAASQPGAEITNPVDRAWERVKSLVTIRQGGKVIVGSHSAALLEDARGHLDAGDLAGAMASLAELDAQAAAAMAPWKAQAQSLLDARAALLALAAKS